MIREKITRLTKLAIQRLFPDSAGIFQDVVIEKPDNPDFGDYAVNIAFALAKQLGKSPREIADELARKITKIKPAEIERVEAVGGYINFFLALEYLREQLELIYKNRESFGQSTVGRGQKIIVEYSQPNIAKQMHIGHLRTTVLGNALANIYENLGYEVIRWNYLGDWGTQFGKLIAAYKLWGPQLRGSASKYLEAEPLSDLVVEPLSKNKHLTIGDLTWLYVKFHQELKEHPELDRRGQEEFAKLEAGDKENRKLWEWFRKLSIKEFEKIYKMLGINFDIWLGESYFEKDLKSLVEDLHKRGVAETGLPSTTFGTKVVLGEKGAIIIKLDRFNLPPALIQKADGASLYLTRDIAALKYRLSKYKPAKLLYVVGNEQSLHFEQLFAIANILGLTNTHLGSSQDPRNGGGPVHVKYGLVLGEDKKKMSTREGEAIQLEEVIQKAIDLARKITLAKTSVVRSPTSNNGDIEKIAKTVAIGALKYEMLKEHRSSDIVFSWEKMLDFTGNSAPYLQYTYARLISILKKANVWKFNFQTLGRWAPNFWRLNLQKLSFSTLLRFDLNKLTEKSELAIIKHLLDFPDVVADSARANLTNNLALYLYELANLANQFYETTPVLKDDNAPALPNSQRELRRASRHARLILIQTTTSVLKTGLKLLGIEVLKRI